MLIFVPLWAVHSSIPLRFISLMRHLTHSHYFNESHTAQLRFASFRWCGIRRLPTTLMSHIQLDCTSLHLADATFVASNKKRICCSESKLSLQHILFLFICDSLLTHKEKYHPRQFNVRNGTRKCASRGSNPAHPD